MADIPADILIYAIVAAGLVFWLRSVLGTRHGDERERPNPFVTSGDKAGEDMQPRSVTPDQDEARAAEEGYDPFGDMELIASSAVSENLREIARYDRSFDPKEFVKNAEDAFALIVECFSDADRDMLENLLAPDVYAAFDQEITNREERGERVITEIEAIRNSKIVDSHITNKTAYISVEFHVEETCVIEDAEGNHISGNPNRSTEMVDIWTFGRSLRSREPTWLLYETRDGEPEDHKTPLPEAGHAE